MDFYTKIGDYYDLIFPCQPVQLQFIEKNLGTIKKSIYSISDVAPDRCLLNLPD